MTTIVSKKVEAPKVEYSIPADRLVGVLGRMGYTHDNFDFAELLTHLEPYADYSLPDLPKKKKSVEKLIKKFDRKIVQALFYLPSEKAYRYHRLCITKSTIKGAGMGVFAVDKIPKNARGTYLGIPRTESNADMYYSWTIKTYDPDTGECDDRDRPLYYVDAHDPLSSNWTRYVNTGMKSSMNNLEMEQLYDKVFYITRRTVYPGEELFIDYGPEYREVNLGMKGNYDR